MAQSKYTPQRRKAILEAVANGHHLKVAAALHEVSEATVHQWQHTHPEFATAIACARAEAEDKCLRVIVSAIPKDWKAAAWYLERTRPDRWARKDTLNIAGPTITADLVAEAAKRAEARQIRLAQPPAESAHPGPDEAA
jgi:hypothetical protein